MSTLLFILALMASAISGTRLDLRSLTSQDKTRRHEMASGEPNPDLPSAMDFMMQGQADNLAHEKLALKGGSEKQNNLKFVRNKLLPQFFDYARSTAPDDDNAGSFEWFLEQADPKDDVMGYILSSLTFWHHFQRHDGAANHGTFWGTRMQNVCHELKNHFPQLKVLNPAGPIAGVADLIRYSGHMSNMKQCVKSVCGGKLKTNMPSEPLFENDLKHVLKNMPRTPSGYRLGAYLCIAHYKGQRPAVYLTATPGKLVKRDNGLYMFDNLYDVKTNVGGHRPDDKHLNELTSWWVGRFLETRCMKVWRGKKAKEREFMWGSTAALDGDINEICTNLGCPNCEFSGMGPRRAFITEGACNLMLIYGKSRAEAVWIMESLTRHSKKGQTIEWYLGKVRECIASSCACCVLNVLQLLTKFQSLTLSRSSRREGSTSTRTGWRTSLSPSCTQTWRKSQTTWPQSTRATGARRVTTGSPVPSATRASAPTTAFPTFCATRSRRCGETCAITALPWTPSIFATSQV